MTGLTATLTTAGGAGGVRAGLMSWSDLNREIQALCDSCGHLGPRGLDPGRRGTPEVRTTAEGAIGYLAKPLRVESRRGMGMMRPK